MWQLHVFIQGDTAINTHQYKMKILKPFMYKRYTLENLHCANKEYNDGQKELD